MQLDRLEERVNDIQQQHQYDVNFLKQEYQQKIRILQNQLEQKVNTTQTKFEQKLSTERKMFIGCLLLSLVCFKLYLTKLEDGVQKNLQENQKVSAIQSQHEKNLSMIKSIEEKVDSLNTHLRVTVESRTFTWKITSFAIKLKQAKNKVKEYVESDPFYMHGYKLKLKMYPNGYVNVKNTHLSIFIFVMKGENDAILPWPFKKKVKFTLIDQQEDSVKRKNVFLSFIPGYRPESFARPTQEENAVSGYTEFISHEKLYSRRYLLDDTLFLQVETGP